MVKRSRRAALVALLAMSLAIPVSAPSHDDPDLASYVDPMIGTMGAGFVFPGPAAPYGMVQLSPDTEGYFAWTGYQYTDQKIRGFSHVHIQSMGVREGGNVPFMPVTGPVSSDVLQYESRFSHATEKAEPGYYKVRLDSYGIDAELTAGLRVGMHRYTFPPGSDARVLIDAGRYIPGGDIPTPTGESNPGTYQASVDIHEASRTVTGTVNPYRPNRSREDYTVHFAARFDRPFSSFGTWSRRGDAITPGTTSVEGAGIGAAVGFDTMDESTVHAKVGISYVSRSNALHNLEAELPGEEFPFDAVRQETRAAWNAALAAIEIEAPTELEKRAFYTALYHAQHHPNIFQDANGQYLGHDDQVHTIGSPGDPIPAGSDYYANFSLWDTYRAEMPLLAMIAPARYRNMMRSLRAIKLHSGTLPRWALNNRNPNYMIGEPAIQTVADAFCRGLVPEDAKADLYSGMVALATTGAAESQVSNHNSIGWVPNAPSTTLELASADFALALVADARGDATTRETFLGRTTAKHDMAEAWRNVIDPQTRFARPRGTGDAWKFPYLPEDSAGFKEGTGWQYTWLVPHDFRGLFDVIGKDMGGDALVTNRLDTFFSTAAAVAAPHAVAEAQQKNSLYGIAYYGNQYAPSNEHDLQAPYAHLWLPGQAWKTQALVRAYQSLYRPAPDGLPGNDDLGTMSAWYIWSALGFYPVIPGAPVYVIGSPAFPKATIHLEGGSTFTVEAPGASLATKYVASAKLGASELSKPWFTHGDLLTGTTLAFEMSAAPNPSWPAGALPPSMSTMTALDDFACAH